MAFPGAIFTQPGSLGTNTFSPSHLLSDSPTTGTHVCDHTHIHSLHFSLRDTKSLMHLQFITCKHTRLFPFSHANTQLQTHSGLNSIFTYAMQIQKLNTSIKITDLQLCNWDQNMVLTLSYINFHSCSRICLFPQPPLCALIIQHLNQPSTCFFLLCQWKLFSINYKTHSLLRFSWLFFISGWKCQFTVLFCLQKYPVYQLYCRTHSLCESACECACELVNVWACESICKIGNECAYMCICRKDGDCVWIRKAKCFSDFILEFEF